MKSSQLSLQTHSTQYITHLHTSFIYHLYQFTKEINELISDRFHVISCQISVRVCVCACACGCLISQYRGMLFLPAGALRRAWAAVWFSACIGVEEFRETALLQLGPGLLTLCGGVHMHDAETHSHMHAADAFTRQQACLCAPVATTTTIAAPELQLNV